MLGSILLAVPVLPGQRVAGDRDLAGRALRDPARLRACAAARPRWWRRSRDAPAGSGCGLAADRADDVRRAQDPAVGDRRVGASPSASASPARPDRSAGCRSRSPSSGRGAASRPLPRPAGRRRSGAPKPKRCTHPLKRSAPSSLPILIAPTLLEWARICDVVRVSSGCSVSSWIVRSATWIWSGMLKPRGGRDQPCCSAPETATTLKVEPGS